MVVALRAQMDGHQHLDVTLELDVLEQDVVTGGEVVGLKQLLITIMMTALMNTL